MHIFFDFDGTLVDITERWWQLHRDVASAFGLPHCTDREEYISQKRSGRREVDIMKKISDNDEGIQVYCRERVKRIELPKYLCYDTLFDDTVPTLCSLRSQGHELAVVTKRRSREDFFNECNELGLSPYIKSTYVDDRVSKKVLLTRHYSASELSHSLFVSDDLADAETARNLGMQSVVAGYGCRTSEFLASNGAAQHIIHSVTDVLSYANS